MRWLIALALLAASGCATLNTAGMSPACRDQYNACLDGCPPAKSGDVDFEAPSCVARCNQDAKSCH